MEKMKLSFQQENDILLNYILETSLIKKIKENNALNFKENQELTNVNDYYIELNITPVCNQKCNYCYLVKYGNELYPPEIRGEENILNNLKIFLDYLLTNNIHPFRFDLFSGEIWGMEFGNKIFDILLEYIDNKNLKTKFIMIPSNMSFLINENATKIIQNYINRFRKRDVDLRFSASFDGKYIDTDTRSFRDENKNILKSNDEFYDKLFSFCKKNNYGFHPMVGAYKIENWKENIVWFYEMIEKYKMDRKKFIMFLEVRNDYWTQEKINSYLDFLNFLIDYEINHFYKNNLEEFSNALFKKDNEKNYINFGINFSNNVLPACTIHKSLIIRLGDLGIGPCHRLHYDKFIYGNYIVENNKIVGLKAQNVQLANRILLGTMNSIPKCSGCLIRDICPKGCFGAQYEASGEILEPINSVCELEKQKSFFIINKYEELGLMEKIKDNFKGLYDQFIKIKDEREYKEWKKLMLQK